MSSTVLQASAVVRAGCQELDAAIGHERVSNRLRIALRVLKRGVYRAARSHEYGWVERRTDRPLR